MNMCGCSPFSPHLLPPCQRGGALVIRRLCGHMGSERVFTELSQILDAEEDLAFASTMVQVWMDIPPGRQDTG